MMPVLDNMFSYMIMGLKFLIPLLFILRINKLKLRFLNIAFLTVAFNISLLFISTIFIARYFAAFFEAYYSGAEYALINRATGPYWFGFWIPTSIYTLLPQLIWFKKICNSVKITYIWFGLAFTLSVYIKAIYVIVDTHMDYLTSNNGTVWIIYSILPPLSESAISISVATIITGLIYLALLKVKKTIKTDS